MGETKKLPEKKPVAWHGIIWTYARYANDTLYEVSKHGVFSGLHFPALGLNTEIYC